MPLIPNKISNFRPDLTARVRNDSAGFMNLITWVGVAILITHNNNIIIMAMARKGLGSGMTN